MAHKEAALSTLLGDADLDSIQSSMEGVAKPSVKKSVLAGAVKQQAALLGRLTKVRTVVRTVAADRALTARCRRALHGIRRKWSR
jgi:hypothetical protein